MALDVTERRRAEEALQQPVANRKGCGRDAQDSASRLLI
jgi:hypothetical protein